MTDKTSRDKCYFARDTYFACLDKHGIISSRQPSVDALMKSSMNPFAARDPKLPPLEPEVDKNAQLPAECKPLRVAFESSCLGSWVNFGHCWAY
jgi:hypothetical protein